MIGFARPWLLLLLVPLFLWWWRRRKRSAVKFGDTRLVEGATRSRWRSLVPPVARFIALAGLILAAAGPRLGGSRVEEKREGIAIVIAIDISSSMLAEDFAPSNRLEVAKRRAIDFVRGRKSDRIGLVAFAGEALTQVPITLDYAVVEQAINALRIGVLEDGTAIGSGLATSVNRLRRVPDTTKVILLLTDGVNNRGLVDPRTAAATAKAFGIRVYTIGVGSDGEAPIPTGRGVGGFRYEVLPVSIDEKLMKEIAEETGGKYFRAKDSEALGRIFSQIDLLEKTAVTVTRYTRFDELTLPFILTAVFALALELVAAATFGRRLP